MVSVNKLLLSAFQVSVGAPRMRPRLNWAPATKPLSFGECVVRQNLMYWLSLKQGSDGGPALLSQGWA